MYVIAKAVNDLNQCNIVSQPGTGEIIRFETIEEAEDFKQCFGFEDGEIIEEDSLELEP